MNDLEEVYQALLRQDPLSFMRRVFATLEPTTEFLSNWHYEHLCWALSRVLRGEVRRLIINVPPRSGKSILATVAWPMFVLGNYPSRRFVCVSHTEDLARKFSIDRRIIAQSGWYRALFPRMQLVTKRPRAIELRTTEHGIIYASGAEGAVHGRGAHIIVVDDPIKAQDALSSEAERQRVADFYDNTLLARLDDKRTGAVVIVMQRLHQDDLVGHVLGRDDWEVISLPAIAVEESVHQLSDDPRDVYRRSASEPLHEARESREVLEQLRRAQSSLIFQAQYQQDPVPPGGNVIRREWIRTYQDADMPEHFDRVIVSWDLASTLSEKSDFSVGTVWGAVGLDYYLLDLFRARREVPELRRDIVHMTEHWVADATIIEASDIGRAVAQDLERRGLLRPIPFRPRIDKVSRLLTQAARFESGQVYLPAEAPFLGEYVAELLAFPNGRHDDQVDSTSQALQWLTARSPADRPLVRRNMRRRNIVRR